MDMADNSEKLTDYRSRNRFPPTCSAQPSDVLIAAAAAAAAAAPWRSLMPLESLEKTRRKCIIAQPLIRTYLSK